MATKTITGVGVGTTTITATFGGQSSTVNFTVSKATGSVTTAPTASNPVYGSTSALCTAGAGTGTMMYRLGSSGNFSSSIPTANGLNAGSYTVYYYAAESTNYTQSSTGNITVSVGQASGTVTISNANPTYGTSGNLASVSGNTGTMYYRLGPSGSFSTTMPTATSSVNTGTYVLYYYVAASTNYTEYGNSSSPKSLSVSVAQAAGSVKTAPTNSAATYGSGSYLCTTGASDTGTMQYKLGSGGYSSTRPTTSGLNVGSYTLYYKAAASTNYTASSEGSITVTVVQAGGGVTISNANPTYGTSNALASVSGATGTMHYKLDSGSWTTTMPTASGLNAGSYTLYYYVDASTNYTAYGSSSSPKSLAVTVAKAAGSVKTAPANNGSTYGSGSYLCTTGASDTGTMQYKLGTGSYSSTRPTTSGLNVGSYTLYYYAAASTNYNASSEGSITVTVVQAGGGVTISNANPTYGTSNNLASVSGATGTMHYKLDSGSWTTTMPTATTSVGGGSHTLYYYVDASTNYTAYGSSSSPKNLAVTVAKANQSAPSVGTPTAITYGSGTLTGSYSGGGGQGTLYYKVDTNGGTNYGTATASAPTRSSAGTTTYIAYWSGNDNYNASPNSSQGKLVVNKANPTMSLSNTDVTFHNTASIKATASVAGTVYWGTTSSTSGMTNTKSVSANTSTELTTRTDLGSTTVYAYFIPTDTSNYNSLGNSGDDYTSKTMTVSQASDATVSVTTAVNAGTYESAATLVTAANSSSHGTSAAYVGYKLGEATADNQITWVAVGNALSLGASAVPGKYYIYKKWTADSNHSNSSGYTSVGSLTRSQASDASVSVTTAANAGTYGSSTTLVTAANSSSHGTSAAYVGYKLGEATADNQITWVAVGNALSLGTTANAGTYYIYKKWTADSNHSNSANYTQVGTLTRSQASGSVSISNANPTYGTSNALASVSGNTGTMYYRLGTSGSFSTTMPTASGLNADSYTLYYYVAASTNYTEYGNSSSPKSLTVTVAKASRSGAVSCADTTYPTTVTATVSGNTESGTVTWGITNGTGKATISNGVVTPTQAGTVTVTASVAATTNYLAYTATSKQITINKATGSVGTPTNPVAKTFSTSSQTVQLAMSGNTGTITYPTSITVKNSGGTTISDWTCTSAGVVTIPASQTVNTYTVTGNVSAAAATNYNAVSATSKSWTVTINKAAGSVTTAPTASNPVYGSGNNLCTAGAGTGTMMYRVGTSGSFSSTIPTTSGLNAGSYTLYYYAAESTNYTQSSTGSITVSVSKADISPTVTMSGYTYAGTKSNPSVSGNSGGGTVTYYYNTTNSNSNGTAWSNVTSSTSLTAGDYWMYATVGSTTNYNGATTPAVKFTISKAAGTGSVTMTGWSYGGTVTNPSPSSSTNGTSSVSYTWYNSSKTALSSKPTSTSTPGTYFVKATFAATNNYTAYTTDYVSFTISQRTGAAPTFAASSVSATAVQAGSAVNAGAFTAATAGHSGSITYAIQGVVKDGTSTQLTGWTMTSTTSRVITVPASTAPATYLVTVRATEAQTTTDTSSYKDAVITVTLSKGTQTLNLDKTELSLTVPNTGTITASGYAGTLSVSSGSTGVATASNAAASTITAVSAGTATITFTAAATTYVNAVSKTATVTVSRRTGATPTFADGTVTATCVQAGTAVNTGAFTAATAGHSGSITYSIVSVVEDGSSTVLSGWTMTSSSRVITVPAGTVGGKTYLVTVRATEAQTSTDSSSTKDAVITVTLNKGSQTLNLDKTTLTVTVGGSTGTITASGYAGTLTVTSGTPAVATASNAAASTITAVKAGTSTITFTAAATNYVNAVSKSATVTVNRRTGAAPTFANSTVTATCVQEQSSRTTSAFTAATAGHSGSITYSIVSVKNSGDTSLSGWSVSSDNRTIGIPANTVSGTYTVVVRATEAQTDYDTSSTAEATIIVTLSKGTQSLTLTSSPTNATTTYPTGGTITASGHVGTIGASSGTSSVATVTTSGSTVTVTAVGQGTSVITVTAAANDYVDSVSKTVTWTINRRTGAAPTFADGTVTATCSQDQTAKTTSAFTAGTAKHGGALSYSLVSAKNSGGSTLSGWSVTSSTRKINIPANTIAGTYTCVVRCTEGQTSTDSSSTTDATITVTLSKGSQSLTLTGNPTNYTTTYNNGGTIIASNHVGTISASSGTQSVATVSVSGSTVTVTCVGAGTSVITVTAAGNDYVDSVSKTVTWTISKADATLPTNWKGDSKVFHQTATLTVEGYSGGTLRYRYDENGGTTWTETTTAPTRTAIGTTTVQCMVVGDANHNDTTWKEPSVTLTIREASDAHMEVITYDRTYNTNNQVIATQDTRSGHTAEGIGTYYLGYYKSDSAATQESQITWGSANSSLSAKYAGTYQIYYKFTPDGNHDNSVDWSNDVNHGYVASVTISKASRSGEVTCSDTTYPGTVQASVSGNTENGTVTWGINPGTGTATISNSGLVTPTSAGTVTVTASVEETDNYLAYIATPKEITIGKISLESIGKPDNVVYTGSAFTPTPAVTATVGGVSTTLTLNTDYTLSYSNNTNVGTATVTATGIGNFTGTVSETWNITGATITVTANNQSYTYDGNFHGTGVSVTTVNNQSYEVKYRTTSSGEYNLTSYPTFRNVVNSGYSGVVYYQVTADNHITYTGSYQLEITPLTAVLSWGITSWMYDGNTHSTTCTVTNLVGTDICDVTLSNNSITNAGDSVLVTATGLSNSNYSLPSSDLTRTLTITAGIFVKVSGQWKPIKQVYKKVSGQWTEQNVNTVFDTSKAYKKLN